VNAEGVRLRAELDAAHEALGAAQAKNGLRPDTPAKADALVAAGRRWQAAAHACWDFHESPGADPDDRVAFAAMRAMLRERALLREQERVREGGPV
jgi:hypothetical protein